MMGAVVKIDIGSIVMVSGLPARNQDNYHPCIRGKVLSIDFVGITKVLSVDIEGIGIKNVLVHNIASVVL